MSDVYDPRLSIQGEGHAMVLVPGMNGSGDLFYRQIPLLARSYRVATYTLRDEAASLDELVGDLSRVVGTVAPVERRAMVVGESFGGAVALTFALAHPEQVTALVILNSFPYFSPQFRLDLAILGLTAVPWNAMPMVRRVTAWRLHSRHTHHAEMRRFFELTAGATRRGYLNRLKLLRRYDVRNRLGDLRQPVLFLAAEDDHLVPSVEQARYMADRVPSSAMRVLTGHGHICLIAPDIDLSAIINDWREP
jgi:3-oxoadipate enol-lactonase/3-oxoadipate enol-lactonase/4-carboxymuconolactone decarboxylase